MVNRSVVIVKAKGPFVRWLKSLPDPADVSLKEINEDSTAYFCPTIHMIANRTKYSLLSMN